MLIEFSVENFLSFKDNATLSMVSARSFKEHQDTHLIHTDMPFDLVKSAIVYGNNASGKSNLLEAMGFMKYMVLSSFRDALMDNKEKKFPLQKFALHARMEKEPSVFEMSFVQQGTRYRYGFEIDYNKVVSEWLFHTQGKEVYLFKRTAQQIEVNKTAFKEGLGKTGDVKDNVLFLSLLATMGKELSGTVVTWFKNFNFVNGIHDRGHKRYTIEKLKSDPDFHKWVLHFVKYLDIADIASTEEVWSEDDLQTLHEKEDDEAVISLLASLQKVKSRQPVRDQLITQHRKYDDDNVLIGTVPFHFDTQESEGTQKLVYLLGPWYDTLQQGKVLVIDELDARLHPQLTLRLLDFFHRHNSQQAQVICAVHDVSLLNRATFRRDQVWFVEKDHQGASALYALAAFKTDKVRNKSAFDKNYLEGKYGAVPYFDIDRRLNEILYGKGEAAQV